MTHLQKSIMKQIDGQLYPQLLTLKIASITKLAVALPCLDHPIYIAMILKERFLRMQRGAHHIKFPIGIQELYDTLNSLGLQSLPMTHNLECI